MKKFLTIIVPVYNTGKLMIPTMNSLLSQSKDDFDIIIINDGSTDTISYDLCQNYADNYENISVIHQNNKGLGGARNEGLRNTKTKYVMFLDSDDILNHNFSERFFKLSKEIPDASFYICEPVCFDSSRYTTFPWYDIHNRVKIPSQIPLSSNDEKLNIYDLEVNFCMRIYNVQYLLNLNFKLSENLFYEDFFPHFFLLYNSETVVISNLRIFYYRTNNATSITGRSDASCLDQLVSFEEAIDYLLSVNVDSSIRIKLLKKTLRHATWILGKSQEAVRKEFASKLPMILIKYPLKDIFELESIEKLKFLALRSGIISRNLLRSNVSIAVAKRMTDVILGVMNKFECSRV